MNNKKTYYSRFFLVITLLLITVFNIGHVLSQQKTKYLSHDYWQRFPSLKSAYYNSVYANKKGTWLPDEVLYAFNGGALITGTSPILVNPEVPPVGKYLIGLSILAFDNENIIILLSICLSLVLLFLLGRQLYSSSLIALIPVCLLSFEPILHNQLVYTPLLDSIHLLFLLLTLYLFGLSYQHKSHSLLFLLLSNISLGLFIATKFFAIGITLFAGCVLVLLLRKDWVRLKYYILTFPIAVFVLLFSYVRVLMLGYPFMKFLGIQKWVLWYNEGHVRSLFSVWALLLMDKWYTAGKVLTDPQWLITWPILTIFTVCCWIREVFMRFSSGPEVQVLVFWSLFYLLFLSFGDASARYFVILIPVLYLLATYIIMRVIIKLFHMK